MLCQNVIIFGGPIVIFKQATVGTGKGPGDPRYGLPGVAVLSAKLLALYCRGVLEDDELSKE